MYSKEESRKLRETFWTAFGKSFPKKWILYKTNIKGLSLKFHFDLKSAMVSMDIDSDLEQRVQLWEKLTGLKSILKEEYLPEAIFEDFYPMEHGKEVSRIYVRLKEVSIHNKNSWRETMEFFSTKMIQFEAFFTTYKDIIDS
ncbi:MAG: DUF4268 domain-containing protein [Maribacter sp.]